MGKSKYYSTDRKDWYVCDFETITSGTKYYQDNQDTKVNLWNMIPYIDGGKSFMGVTMEEFIETIQGYGKSMTLFFHNLSFDGDFILKHLLNKMKLNIVNATPRTFIEGVEMFKQKNRNFNIKWRFQTKGARGVKRKKISIYIRCSYLMLSSSIGALGKGLGIKKHQSTEKPFYDYEPFQSLKDAPEDFKEYIGRDCKIAQLSMINFEKAMNDLPLVKKSKKVVEVWNSLTVASLGEKIQRNYYIKQFKTDQPEFDKVNFQEHGSMEQFKHMQKFVTGGWTQFNPLYQNNERMEFEGCIIDIASSYPNQMVGNLPYGERLDMAPVDGEFVEFIEVEVISAKIKPKYKNVVTLKNWNKKPGGSRYVRELNEFTCYYVKKEWDFLNKMYNFKVRYKSSFYMRAAPFLKQYITDVFFLKQEMGRIGNAGMKQAYKILLNAGYGKYAQRYDFETLWYSFDQYSPGDTIEIPSPFKEGAMKEYIVLRETSSYVIKEGVRAYFLEEVKESCKYKNNAVAAVILSRARLQLWEAILEVGAEHFVYSDTDSIVFKTRDTKGLTIGDNLGDWEIEKLITSFVTTGAKRYLAYNGDEVVKTAFAGVQITQEHIDMIDFGSDENIIMNAGLVREYCPSGLILTQRDLSVVRGTL